jgi:hypothetical protein
MHSAEQPSSADKGVVSPRRGDKVLNQDFAADAAMSSHCIRRRYRDPA